MPPVGCCNKCSPSEPLLYGIGVGTNAEKVFDDWSVSLVCRCNEGRAAVDVDRLADQVVSKTGLYKKSVHPNIRAAQLTAKRRLTPLHVSRQQGRPQTQARRKLRQVKAGRNQNTLRTGQDNKGPKTCLCQAPASMHRKCLQESECTEVGRDWSLVAVISGHNSLPRDAMLLSGSIVCK